MVQVYVLRATVGGAPFADPKKMRDLLEFALQCYERLGVWMATHVTDADKLAKGAELAQAGSAAKVLFSYLVIDPPDGVDPEKLGLQGMIKLANAYPASDSRIPRVFVIKGIRAEEFLESTNNVPLRDSEIFEQNKNLLGLTFDPVSVRRAQLPAVMNNTSWVEVDNVASSAKEKSSRDPSLERPSNDAQTFAHELGHLLMDKEAWLAGHGSNSGPISGYGLGHFAQPRLPLDASGTPMNPAPPGHRLLRQANLMHFIAVPHGVCGAKRIWRAPDEHGYSWGDALASSPMLR